MDSMEARFGHLRQRDTSVDMLRVKMSRRRSQSQKENRDKALNSRRQLDKLPELECSQLDMSVVESVSVVQEKAPNAKQVKNAAVEERIKKLARYKEKKELVKEKEKRAREKKGVFKVGLYRPLAPLPQAPAATIKARATTAVVQPQSTRVTRSNMRQQAPKLPQSNDTLPVSRKVEPAVVRSTRRTRIAIVEQVVRAPSTRSANIPPVSVAPVAKDKPAAAPKTRSNAKQSAAPPVGRGRNTRGSNKQAAVKVDEPLEDHRSASPPPPSAEEEDEKMVEGPAPEPVPSQADPILPPAPTPSSFAPQGFVFQAPAGLSSFKPTPLTPRSADSFFKPSVPVLHPVPLWPSDNLVTKMELSVPSPAKSPSHSPPHPSPTLAPRCLPSPKEPEHDVPYFRSVVVSETESLTEFCQQWESRVDDVSVPEEMCDRMRTAVGQARLLMKERFGQFSGLVDDCELGRGEKITTCTDLQGFWDMVSYQVEDVNKKFGALKEAESKGWQEESKPPPRQRKVVKKPPSALVPKPAGGAAAKSRLAAIKAAIKAKQQAAEAENAAGPGSAVDNPAPAPQDPQAETQAPEPPVVVFQGGFFQVESPAKLTGSVRRSTRVSAMPQASPCSVTKFSTSGRTRHSNTAAAAHASPLPCLTLSPAHPTLTPACSTLTPACPSDATPLRTPHTDHEPQSYTLAQSSPTRVSLCFSPVKEALMDTQSEEGPSNQPELASVQNDVTPDQPEPESMQEAVACDQSELVSEPTVCPEEHYVSCESEEIGQSPSNTQQLTNDEQHQEAFSQTVLATEEPNQLELQDRKEALEAYDTSLPISPGLPLSPSLPHTQVRSPAFSFNLSPTPARPRLTEASLSPLSCLVPPSSPPAVQVSLGFPADADVPVTVTPDTSITEGIPGLDFERYLQPAVRCSLSPRELAVAEEMLSPMAIDVEMETPLAPSGEPPQEEVSTPTAFPSLAQMLTPRTTQPVESLLLLFTPDQMDRVRQSICPSDLMSFTPPSD